MKDIERFTKQIHTIQLVMGIYDMGSLTYGDSRVEFNETKSPCDDSRVFDVLC
jgi:hypothetical protein